MEGAAFCRGCVKLHGRGQALQMYIALAHKLIAALPLTVQKMPACSDIPCAAGENLTTNQIHLVTAMTFLYGVTEGLN